MRDLEQLEALRVHSVLYADDQLFRDLSCLSKLKKLCVEILCVDVLVERTDALKQLALLRNLEDLELAFRRYSLQNKQAFQYLLHHLPKLRRLALRKCSFRFPDISVIFTDPPAEEDAESLLSDSGLIVEEDAENADSWRPLRVSRLNLEELDLSGTLQHGLNDEAVAALDTLKTFRLQTHEIDDTLREFFISSFTKWTKLRELGESALLGLIYPIKFRLVYV